MLTSALSNRSATIRAARMVRINRPRRPTRGMGVRTTTSAVTFPVDACPCSASRAASRHPIRHRGVTPRVLEYEVTTAHKRSRRLRRPYARSFRTDRGLPAVSEVLQRGQGTVERGHLDEREAGDRAAQRLGAVSGRREEVSGTVVVCGDHLLRDATDL